MYTTIRGTTERIAFPQLSTESILVGNLPITKQHDELACALASEVSVWGRNENATSDNLNLLRGIVIPKTTNEKRNYIRSGPSRP